MSRKLDIRRIAEGMDALDHEYLLDYEFDKYEHIDIRVMKR